VDTHTQILNFKNSQCQRENKLFTRIIYLFTALALITMTTIIGAAANEVFSTRVLVRVP